MPQFINDCIARTLAGVTQAGRPLFLKMVYHGPKAMEELAAYDPHLVIGILGGGAGTTYDAFKLLAEAKKYGARVALFGRKINGAECQLAFVQFLRLIVDGQISPEEAVRAYHGVLEQARHSAASLAGGRPASANRRDELPRHQCLGFRRPSFDYLGCRRAGRKKKQLVAARTGTPKTGHPPRAHAPTTPWPIPPKR